jgi:hypothetical protein
MAWLKKREGRSLSMIPDGKPPNSFILFLLTPRQGIW